VIAQEERLRGLVDMGILLTSQLSLETVLDKLLEAAMNLTGAGYAALGVVHRSGRGLERFLHRGVDDETVRQIGDLPVGRGILGALIERAQPLRLHDLSEDPRSVGFPPGHPEMRTFLGVPVLLRGVVYGNLYLTEKQGGEDFTEEDQEVATVLAAQAAVAIENARLYESQTRWMRQLESMEEIGLALVSDLELPRMLELICRRLRELVGARTVFVALPTVDGDLRVEAAADDQNGVGAIGTSIPVPESMTGRAYAARRTFRVDSFIDDPEIDQALARRLAELMGLPPPTAGVFAPLLVRDRAIGAIVAHDKVGDPSGDLRFGEGDVRLVEAIAARAAVAVDLSTGWSATEFDASSPRRSRSGSASPASSTTRPVRRSRRCCSGCALQRRRRTRKRDAGRSHRCESSPRPPFRTFGGSRWSSGRRPSTTSGSSRRWSAWSRASGNAPASTRSSKRDSTSGSPTTPRRPCTGSCRRRSRTSSSTRERRR
jgi:GAF domain-containing protein